MLSSIVSPPAGAEAICLIFFAVVAGLGMLACAEPGALLARPTSRRTVPMRGDFCKKRDVANLDLANNEDGAADGARIKRCDMKQQGEAPGGRGEALSPRDVRAVMMGLMLAMMLAALDATIVGPAMSTIGRDLGDYEHLPWVVTAYLLVSTALTPLYGKLADIHGRRIMLLVAVASFVAGSIACALSPTMIVLSLSRGLQGVGGAGVSAMTMTIMGDIVPLKERPKYQLYSSVVWIMANLAGPIVGGDLSAWLSWRVIFWINVPLGVTAWWVTSGRLRMIPRHEKPHRLDLLGAALLVAASSSLLICLNIVGEERGWNLSHLATPASAAACLWALLVWRQSTAQEPLIPLSVLSNRIVVAGMTANGAAMGAYLGAAIYVPVFFQTVLGFSVAQAGAATLPLMVGTTIGSVSSVRLMPKIRKYWMIPRIGLVMASAAAIALSFVGPTTPFLLIEALMLALATGVGPIFPVVNVSIQASTPGHELGTSMSLVTFMRNLGAALGVALLGTIVIGGVADDLSRVSAQVSAAAAQSAGAGFHVAFLVVAVGFALSCACLSIAKEPPLSGTVGRAAAGATD